ncbi:cytochrome b561 [Syntrophus gentianae]|uniref:Cytochrome b561 n=2 Tax=Syntrophus gentianae TaxID=43775 RepID=A0A1H7UQC2_9BACT|nr:cytochrome b561 [Syntrophus gentianae]
MLTASALLLTAVTVARIFRHKVWWLKGHRRLALCGVAILAAGFLAAIVLISSSGQPHFGSLHPRLGGLTLSGAVLTPVLGFSVFRFPIRAAAIRRIHRVSGRLTAILTVITILSGLLLIGIF